MAQRNLGTGARVGALAFTLLLVLAGCGSQGDPSTARPGGSTDAPFYLDLSGGPDAQGLTGRGGASAPLTPPTNSQSFLVDGSRGDVLTFRRFTLRIPPGAFQGQRLITIEDPENGFVECRLYPEGMQFDLPVTLSMDLANTSADGRDATIYWYDPSAEVWVDLGGTYAVADHSVWVRLQHFCSYRGGRAGW